MNGHENDKEDTDTVNDRVNHLTDDEEDFDESTTKIKVEDDPELRAKKIDELFTSVRFGMRGEVLEILRLYPDLVNEFDSRGFTTVHWASKKGDTEMLTLLHSYGAKLSEPSQSESRTYAVHWAASEGRIAALRFLLNHRQDINCVDASGCTPVILAVQHNQPTCVVFLWKNGCDMEIQDCNGDTAIHWAAYMGYPEMLGLLSYIMPHALNQEDKHGQSALHLAALRGVKGADDALDYLVNKCSMELTKRDRSGNTALDLACNKGNMKHELILRKKNGSNLLQLIMNIGFKRLRNPNFAVLVLCGANDKEIGAWPWRVVFSSNFIASVTTLQFIFNPVLEDLYYLHIMNAIFQSVWWFMFLMCLFKEPAYVRDENNGYSKMLDVIGEADSNEGLPSLCHSCHIVKPIRSKHCKVQGHCINKFDHFCPFVGNTVNRDNYCYFVGLLAVHVICESLWLITVVYLYRRASIGVLLGCFAFYSLFWMLMVGALLQYHSFLLMSNLTTNEHIGVSKYAYLHDPTTGMFDNPFNKASTIANVIDGLFPDTKQHYSRNEVLEANSSGDEEKVALMV